MTTALAVAFGITSTLSAQAHWSTVRAAGRWARWHWHRLLSIGADDQSTGLPRLPGAERHLAAAAMRYPTEEFCSLIGTVWAPSTEDVWSTP